MSFAYKSSYENPGKTELRQILFDSDTDFATQQNYVHALIAECTVQIQTIIRSVHPSHNSFPNAQSMIGALEIRLAAAQIISREISEYSKPLKLVRS